MEEDLTRSWCWKMAALRKPLFGKKKKIGNVFGISFHGKCGKLDFGIARKSSLAQTIYHYF